jgi:multidrug resistance efflux pump
MRCSVAVGAAVGDNRPARVDADARGVTDAQQHLRGRVESIAYGIARRNLGSGGDLADVAPTFEWIRLAQRIPVRIVLIDPPLDLPLRIGYTASIGINPSEPVASDGDTGGR